MPMVPMPQMSPTSRPTLSLSLTPTPTSSKLRVSQHLGDHHLPHESRSPDDDLLLLCHGVIIAPAGPSSVGRSSRFTANFATTAKRRPSNQLRRCITMPQYNPAPDRYQSMPYRRCGRSGVHAPGPVARALAQLRRGPDPGGPALDRAARLRPRDHPLRPGQQLRAALRQRRDATSVRSCARTSPACATS